MSLGRSAGWFGRTGRTGRDGTETGRDGTGLTRGAAWLDVRRGKVQLAAPTTGSPLKSGPAGSRSTGYPTLPGSAGTAILTVATWAFPARMAGKDAVLHYPGSRTGRDENGTGRERDRTGRERGRNGTELTSGPPECRIRPVGPVLSDKARRACIVRYGP